MKDYIIRRLLLVIPTFLGISLVVFTITRFVPGGPIERMMMEMQAAKSLSANSTKVALSEEQLNQLKVYYGFDKPVFVAYGIWLGKVMQFDFGYSTRYGESVWETIKQRLPVSVFFGISTLILTYLICIPLGVFKALYHKSYFDSVSSFLLFVGHAVPGYIIGILLLVFLGARWEFFPIGGFVSDDYDQFTLVEKLKDLVWHAVLPLSAYMFGSVAVETFVLKNSLMEQFSSDYMRTGVAKGLTFKQAVWRHAFKNSIIPIATHFGNNISLLIAGSFLIERIFNINGFGLLGYEAIVDRDYPVVMGILVISAALQLTGNILSDLCVAWVDPRVKFDESRT